ncbi:conserved hypothetical protein [Desulfonatronospira thiodismutans ASO3-1]|uniref:Uncharacterized protein n=1 Tax=Desulfonatronospira thiodismutans ASO3-1 TaxID=555779 RepID=D6SSP8_9BACT|nr:MULTISPECIES: hypothetical protein [Desulfonatronospira]EFI33714.1 conserved hypothetical protein [Desulfonatronospira thiodismutans ASO3-1]RQD73551.1 MAG: hypothetical protein D5S03_12425 [Desulfonatronospira sp. MSAO_Bac3]
MAKTCIFVLAVILMGGVLIMGCSEAPEVPGVYQEVSENGPDAGSTIELQEDRKGTWETPRDSVSFRWSVREGEIWLHTETGGVIIGELSDSGFVIELPEAGTYVFEKTGP